MGKGLKVLTIILVTLSIIGSLGLFNYPVTAANDGSVNWYVSPKGSDSNGKGTLQSPWKTIQYAIDQASTGNNIYILPGTYSENLNITKDVSLAGKSIIASAVVIDGQGLDSVINAGPVNCTISNLTVQNARGNGINMIVPDADDAATSPGSLKLGKVTVRNNSEDGVYVCYQGSKKSLALQMQDCDISGNTQEGIQMEFVTAELNRNYIHDNGIGIRADLIFNTGLIQQNIISGNKEGGVFLHNARIKMEYNSLLNNAGYGIGLDFGEVEIRNNIIQNTEGYGITGDECSITIDNNLIKGNSENGINGIYLIGSITRNVIEGNNGDGIRTAKATLDIENNLIVKNKKFGVVAASFNRGKIVNNSIADNGGGIDIDETSSEMEIFNNIVVWNSQDFISSIKANYSDLGSGNLMGDHNISADPLFVNRAQGNYHLKVKSPCKDTGTNEGAPEIDLEGNARPMNGITDMGCYEYKQLSIKF